MIRETLEAVSIDPDRDSHALRNHIVGLDFRPVQIILWGLLYNFLLTLGCAENLVLSHCSNFVFDLHTSFQHAKNKLTQKLRVLSSKEQQIYDQLLKLLEKYTKEIIENVTAIISLPANQSITQVANIIIKEIKNKLQYTDELAHRFGLLNAAALKRYDSEFIDVQIERLTGESLVNACLKGQANVLSYLFKHGANPEVTDNKGVDFLEKFRYTLFQKQGDRFLTIKEDFHLIYDHAQNKIIYRLFQEKGQSDRNDDLLTHATVSEVKQEKFGSN